jgi:quercetin dioxygenase-like cupin family protein
MPRSDHFIKPSNADWTEAAPGVRRRLLGYGDTLMLVEFAFEKGAVGAMHSHPHVQSSYVASGRFELTIDGAKKVLKPGDAYYVPANTEHGCLALEAGTLIDAFAPLRKDLLN